MKRLLCFVICLSMSLSVCLSGQAEEADIAAARLAAYRTALETLYQQHRYPNGEEADLTAVEGQPEDNAFALCDVDGDGQDELIFHLPATGAVASHTENVYRYDSETGALAEELIEYPAVTYYANGYAAAQWSHNQGLSDDDFWPYNLYVYSAETQAYELVASVDAWARARSLQHWEFDFSYPDQIDAEGAGSVYLVTPRGGDTDVLSQTDYHAWLAAFGLTEPIAVAYLPLTAENIAAIGAEE